MQKISRLDRAAIKKYLASTDYDVDSLRISRHGMTTIKYCRDKRPSYQPYDRINIGWVADVLRDARRWHCKDFGTVKIETVSGPSGSDAATDEIKTQNKGTEHVI